jgi:hypothetical protein
MVTMVMAIIAMGMLVVVVISMLMRYPASSGSG